MVLIGGHGANPMGESIVPLNSMGLDDVIIAPYVPTETVGPFIGHAQCKVSDKDKPIIEQLNECKKQRIGWLKI
mgnify:CR=1 FL=1